MEETFYKKVGARYIPVSYYDSDIINSVGEGAHLVIKLPGSTLTKHRIDPALAPMIAAGELARQEITNAIFTAGEARPKNKLVTEEQRAAWKKLHEVTGDEMFYISYPSAYDISEAAITELAHHAEKLLSNESVRAAYDHFRLVCELAKRNDNV